MTKTGRSLRAITGWVTEPNNVLVSPERSDSLRKTLSSPKRPATHHTGAGAARVKLGGGELGNNGVLPNRFSVSMILASLPQSLHTMLGGSSITTVAWGTRCNKPEEKFREGSWS